MVLSHTRCESPRVDGRSDRKQSNRENSSPLRKNIVFHCFSSSDDDEASNAYDRNQDVKERLQQVEGKVNDRIDRRKSLADRGRALIAMGVYLHCLADSWSHSGYGGEWDGHTKSREIPGGHTPSVC